ncbi:hypothetical protein [Blastococcus sp. SYSU DS0533]
MVSRTRTARCARRCKRLHDRAFLVRHAEVRASLALLFGPEPAGATD